MKRTGETRTHQKRGSMSRSAKIVTIVLLVVITGVVGVFAWFQGRNIEEHQDAVLTPVEKVLCRDLTIDYPPTPREVIKYYIEIEKCFYADDTTEEELESLGLKARELYDEELLENNKLDEYLVALKADVDRFKKSDRRFVNGIVASSVEVDRFQEDGFEFARLNCGYSIVDEGVTKRIGIVYLLRKDENKLWKIYGWDNVENVQINEE